MLASSKKAVGLLGLTLAVVLLVPSVASAQAAGENLATEVGVDTLWVTIAAMLVFFMQAGFGMVEAGFIRSKNAVNILTKNFIDYCSASLMFFLVGYAFMFGDGNGFIGWSGWMLLDVDPLVGTVQTRAFWFFQAAFCGAAATIVAGGMAGRMKFGAYLMYTVAISGLVYPIVGHWIWQTDQGWLAQMGFSDFAGSTVVHATGGWAAFIGTILLGPRIGKYVNGKIKAIPGHNIPLASLGVFILWFGWFGFNPGSTVAVGDGSLLSRVAMNTNLSAAAGAITAMLAIWAVGGKPDLGMVMNGALAGLVAITAPCAQVEPLAAIVIGAVGGVIVVLGALLLDRLRIDDPVGAVPVHGMNGIWGTLAIGLFATDSGLFYGHGIKQLGVQALGTFAVSAFVVVTMGIVFATIKYTYGLRVSKDEELRGLDIGEHGLEAYAGFQVFVTE
ncbi:MAG: ammonium transporter [Planctomycetes bacterium]|nr:ammonium transporter [Phycisphaerae bacterium]NBB94239.1 ammonium transporter [Planctomycetota bacterium]